MNEIKSNFRNEAATKVGEEADFLAAAEYVEKFIIQADLSELNTNQFIDHLKNIHKILARSLLADLLHANLELFDRNHYGLQKNIRKTDRQQCDSHWCHYSFYIKNKDVNLMKNLLIAYHKFFLFKPTARHI